MRLSFARRFCHIAGKLNILAKFNMLSHTIWRNRIFLDDFGNLFENI
jgi:hypothetical protein